MANVKRLMTINELVENVGMTKWFWRTQIWDGHLPYIEKANKFLVDSEDVEKFIEVNKKKY